MALETGYREGVFFLPPLGYRVEKWSGVRSTSLVRTEKRLGNKDGVGWGSCHHVT